MARRESHPTRRMIKPSNLFKKTVGRLPPPGVNAWSTSIIIGTLIAMPYNTYSTECGISKHKISRSHSNSHKQVLKQRHTPARHAVLVLCPIVLLMGLFKSTATPKFQNHGSGLAKGAS